MWVWLDIYDFDGWGNKKLFFVVYYVVKLEFNGIFIWFVEEMFKLYINFFV